MTDNQRIMMQHALGNGSKSATRNYYCVPIGSTDEYEWQRAAVLGLAEAGRTINGGRDRYYHVTPHGIAWLKEEAVADATDAPSGGETSEIARIVAADLAADFGPDQRSAAGDLARLVGMEGRVKALAERLDRIADSYDDYPLQQAAYKRAAGMVADLVWPNDGAALCGGGGDTADGGSGQGERE